MTRRMRAADLHPELRNLFRFFPSLPVYRGWMLRLMQWATSAVRTPRGSRGITHHYLDLGEGRGVHVFAPEGSKRDPDTRRIPGVLWIHGGGFVIGNAAQDHRRCIALARDLNVVVFSAEYRHAPRHPFPAALEDVHAAWNSVLDQAERWGVDTQRLAIAGQSAGGGLAATLVQRVHDEGGVQPVAQWLFCPMLDDRTAADTSLDAAQHYVWNNRANRAGWRAYLGHDPESATPPAYAAAARRVNLSGLPPAWIGAGDIELFYAEDRRYAEALNRDGVATEFSVVQGAPHAFESFTRHASVTANYLAEAEEWLREQFAR